MSNGADAARSFELSGVAAVEPTDGSRGARGGDGTDNAASDRSLGRRSGLGARHAKMDPQQSFYAAERTAMFLLCGGSTPQFSFSAVFFYHTKEYCGNSDTTQPDRFLDINTKPQVDSVPTFDIAHQIPAHGSKSPHVTEFVVKKYRKNITCGAQPPHVIDRAMPPTTHFEQCGIAVMRIARVARPPACEISSPMALPTRHEPHICHRTASNLRCRGGLPALPSAHPHRPRLPHPRPHPRHARTAPRARQRRKSPPL